MSNRTVKIDIDALYAIDNLDTDEKNKFMKEPDKFRIEVSFFLEDCFEFFEAMLQRELLREIEAKANFKGSHFNEKDANQNFDVALSKCTEYLKGVATIAREKGITLSNVPIIDANGDLAVTDTEVELAIYDIIRHFKELRLNGIS